MSIEFQGLTEFQKDLLEVAQKRLPRETKQLMGKVGSRMATHIRRQARSKVSKKEGVYHKRFKRGKVFQDSDGGWVVRVYNSSPHAHLIEYGHRLVRGGREVGFVTGKNVVYDGAKEFDNSGDFEKTVSTWLDEQLDKGNL